MRNSAILFLLLLFSLSCKMGSDILASTNRGDISRKELHDWLESRSILPDSIYSDRFAMSDYLRQSAVEKLTASEAEEKGYDDKERHYGRIENTLYKNHLASFFTGKKQEELRFNENCFDLSIIRINADRNKGADAFDGGGSAEKIIEGLLAELNSGEDFNELALRFSEDSAAKLKGHLGVIPESLLEDEIKSALIQLNDNDYTKSPVVSGKFLCLLKLHARYEINDKNIRKIITNRDNAEKIIDYYRSKTLDEISNRMMKEKDVVSRIDRADYFKKDEVLFSVGGDDFAVSELEDILNLFYSLKYGTIPSEDFSLKEKKATSEKIFKEWLLALAASEQRFDDDPLFRRNWLYLKRAARAGYYKYDILMRDIIVTEDDMKQEYLKNRDSRYCKIEKINKKEVKVVLPYREVKPSIKSRLSREKLKILKKAWDRNILENGNYRVIDKDFLID